MTYTVDGVTRTDFPDKIDVPAEKTVQITVTGTIRDDVAGEISNVAKVDGKSSNKVKFTPDVPVSLIHIFGAQQRVYLPVIGGVVAVVLVGFEDRVQIDAGHAQIFQIVQLAADTVQIAAAVVVVPDVSVLVGLVAVSYTHL